MSPGEISSSGILDASLSLQWWRVWSKWEENRSPHPSLAPASLAGEMRGHHRQVALFFPTMGLLQLSWWMKTTPHEMVGHTCCVNCIDRKGLGQGLKGSEDREQGRPQESGAGTAAGRGVSRCGIWNNLIWGRIGHLKDKYLLLLVPAWIVKQVKINHSYNQCASSKALELFKSGNLGQVGPSGG